MSKEKNHHSVHREWLQHLQPEGLVVTPNVLEEMGFYPNRAIGEERAIYAEITELNEVDLDHAGQNIVRLKQELHSRLFSELFQWGELGKNRLELLVNKDKIRAQKTLNYKLPEYDETLRPSYALYDLDTYDKVIAEEEAQNAASKQAEQSDDEEDFDPFAMYASAPIQEEDVAPSIKYSKIKPVLLVKHIKGDTPLDQKRSEGKKKQYWDETYHNRFERLLREVEVPVGILTNDLDLRLIYAPKGESSGYVTFNYTHLREASGRSLLSALIMLLNGHKLTESKHSLPNAMKASRKHQATVSEKLSKQVLDAFWALLRGFEAAHMDKGEHKIHRAFQDLAHNDTTEIYEGVLTTIMRLIFLVYVEEEGLIEDDESSAIYQQSYSVIGLFHRLEQDAVRYEGSMSERRGAWAQLLTLTRMIFNGGSYKGFKVPVRQGELFDPERFPFLEGRSHEVQSTQNSQSINVPPINDECIHQVLSKLLRLDGERLSYRALGVEEIGAVYESMMGYEVECAEAQSVVLQPNDVVVRLDHILAVQPGDRKKWLETTAETKLSGSKTEKERLQKLKEAQNEDELFEALKGKLSPRSSERLVKGSLYLQPGEERRRTGSHYTPRSLSNPVVVKALEPHLNRIKKLPKERRAQAILKLKVCDPAMGSGAFLVETCRQLADALVEAWQVSGKELDEARNEESVLEARRRIAQACLYGVDRNPYAVSLAKLSLWLFTLSKDQSFTFLDHSLRCGNSLIGIGNKELAKLEWVLEIPKIVIPQANSKGKATQKNKKSGDVTGDQASLELDFTNNPISKSISARLNLIKDGGDNYEVMSAAYEKAKLATVEMKVIADALVSTFFSPQSKREREKAREALKTKVLVWSKQADGPYKLELFEEFKAQANSLSALDYPMTTFHWGLEFPEAFMRGFDCFVGNPPFVGGRNTTSAMGKTFQQWLETVFEGSKNSADLCSYFFRNAYTLLKPNGTIGFVATKSIAEGTTKETGLKWICDQGGTIYNAVRRRRWPGRDTNVKVSIVNLIKGEYQGEYILDGDTVPEIKESLTTFSFSSLPQQLEYNHDIAFQGTITQGMGFTFDDRSDKGVPLAKMREILQSNPQAAERIFPYLGGHELNTDPEHRHHRYVINFGNMSESEAWQWPQLMNLLKETVYPSRSTHKNPNIRKYPWWQHWNRRDQLYAKIAESPRILLTNAQAAAHLCFSFYEGRAIFANSINVMNLSDWASFACLQSTIHEVWTKAFSTSLGDQIRYNPTTCFRTFPRPVTHLDELNKMGEKYHTFRAKLMQDMEFRKDLMDGLDREGLTETYNKYHSDSCLLKGIVKLRQLHVEMDKVVAKAFGWNDLPLVYDWIDQFTDRRVKKRREELERAISQGNDEEVQEFEMKPRLTFTPELKVEVLRRLFKINQSFS